MSTSNWLTIIGAIASAALTYGVMSTKVAGLVGDVKDLTAKLEKFEVEWRAEWSRAREATGKRIDDLGKDVAQLQVQIKLRRRTTGVGIPPTDITR